MHLLFIRHGETDWNAEMRIQGRTDTPLNARGLEQARMLAAHIAAEGEFEALYSSPQARARVTAETIARQINLAPIVDERLREKGLGELEGLAIPEVEQRFPDFFRKWRTSFEHVALPGEEAPHDLQARVQAFLNDLKARHSDGSRVAG